MTSTNGSLFDAGFCCKSVGAPIDCLFGSCLENCYQSDSINSVIVLQNNEGFFAGIWVASSQLCFVKWN